VDTNQANKFKLLFLLTVVIVPITLATWYYGKAVQGGVVSTTNKGQLVIPVVDLTTLQLVNAAGKPAYQSFEELTTGVSTDDYKPRPWQLLYLGGSECDAACVERLYFLRQIHARLGADGGRVQGVYVQAKAGAHELESELAALMAEEQAGMTVVFADPAALRKALAPSARQGEDPLVQHYIYLADPVGNVMLYFTPKNTPEEILSDLNKLLKQSSLG
jgi:cytochrome oxidase Cu insertion factor (SCO1/SenC/PrrC family)